MCSKKLQRKCINCSVWNFFPSSLEIISFLNTAWKELPKTTIYTFPHAVSYLKWDLFIPKNDRKTWQFWKIYSKIIPGKWVETGKIGSKIQAKTMSTIHSRGFLQGTSNFHLVQTKQLQKSKRISFQKVRKRWESGQG